MFNQIFTSIGIGDAKVDTKINQNEYIKGDTIKGIVTFEHLEGMQIDRVTLTLIERKQNNDETSEFSTLDEDISSITLNTIHDNDIPFELSTAHININPSSQYIIKTHVFVDSSVDYFDEDEVIIKA